MLLQEEITEVKCHKKLVKVCQVSPKKFTSSTKTVTKIRVLAFALLHLPAVPHPPISRYTPPPSLSKNFFPHSFSQI